MPYLSAAKVVLGSSAAAPISLAELCALAGREPSELFDPDMVFEYGPAGGSLELRERIGAELPGLIPDNIAVTSGAGDALAAVAMLTCRPGGHVIVEVPVHESLLAAVDRSGSEATLVQAPIDAGAIVDRIRPMTTAVFLSSPHNPTGQIVDGPSLRLIADAAADVGAILVVDEVFRGLPLGVAEPPEPVAMIAANAVTIGGLSKVYGLPGLRVGWVAGPTLLVDDVRSLQRYMSRCPPATSEVVAKLALECREQLLSRARALVYDSFVELAAVSDRCEGMRLPVPDGGTAAFPEIDVPDVDRWCARIVEDYGILVAPGQACFGIPGRIRINLALEPQVRAAAFPLLARALAESPEILKRSAR